MADRATAKPNVNRPSKNMKNVEVPEIIKAPITKTQALKIIIFLRPNLSTNPPASKKKFELSLRILYIKF